MPILPKDSLLLYKQRAARLVQTGDKKIEIKTAEGESLSVRPKDVTLLHPGPVANLGALRPPKGEVMAAWELLAGETVDLAGLADLAYGDFTPAGAWALWQMVDDGLYFSGDVDAVTVHTAEAVAEIQAGRAAKAAEAAAWQAFLDRVQAGQHPLESEDRYMADVVAVALGQQSQSRTLRALDREATPESAHALLLAVGYWDEQVNPYPQRLGATLGAPDLPLPAMLDEGRRDLTHLIALAIDDEGSQDPDDAISWEAGRLWVHVADAAALIHPGSALDQEARARGANLYLPEGTIPMLPPAATPLLGLGLNEISPALSFGLDVTAAGEIVNIEIVPSWVRVTRMTYAEAEGQLDTSPLREIDALSQAFTARRQALGALDLDLPEVRVRVTDGQVSVRPYASLYSRNLVRDAMLLAGEGAARFALENQIPVPFSTQERGPDLPMQAPATLSGNFALRRLMRPSQVRGEPDLHAGLGMAHYTQTTSPLRRYADLLAHQQLRAFLAGQPLLDHQTLMQRAQEASLGMSLTRQTERISNRHWTLVYLRQNPTWRGEAVVVENNGRRCLAVIPELDLDGPLYGGGYELDQVVSVTVSGINLAQLQFSIHAG
ncbi:MAG: RNB domain-containing ribonuclease [Caldilineaceae bacterium]|nr:RNB domain-containing ribonuclease [Caldilineaceae bacterium]